MPVAHNPLAPVIVDQASMAFDKNIDLGLDGLHQHPQRSLTQNAEQRIILDKPTWPWKANNIVG